MKFTTLSIALGLVLATTLGYADPLPETANGSEVYVVDFYEGQEAAGNGYLQGLAAENKIRILEVLGSLGDAIIQAPESEVLQIRQQPYVKVVEEDGEMEIMGWVDEVQPDSLRGRGRHLAEDTPYGINMVNAADVPNLPSGKSWKKVCVVDTGYENSHPDLPTLDSDAGFSPYGTTQKWDVDGNGHGTHCAGTIGAIGDNNVGVDSVMNTYGSGFENFFIGKGLQNTGGGSWSGVISAMNKCEEKGASVISMSLGGSSSSTSFRDAAKTLHEKGVLLIAAAGNGASSRLSYPASYDHVMSVAAVSSNRMRASFSQYNNQVEISGPGVSVKSTYRGGTYRNLSGTSMATPHVAGVAGLVWSHFPDCKPMQIRYALSKTANHEDSNQPRCNTQYGHGVVDAKAAYDFLAANPCSSWPADFQDNTYVKTGCYVPANDTPWPTPSPVAPPSSTPAPSSAPIEGCEGWCSMVTVPWKPASSGALAKCDWTDYCDKCPECTCKSWCSAIPVTDIPWNATSTGGRSKCGTFESFCAGCDEC